MRIRFKTRLATAIAVATTASVPAALADSITPSADAGTLYEHHLAAQSQRLFGFGTPLAAPSDTGIPRAAGQVPMDRQQLAKGLKAEFVTRAVGGNGDMITFWPNDLEYTHLVVCSEVGRGGTTPEGNDGLNSSVQRVNVVPGPNFGKVETILYGMARCDGIRTTQWGTVLATEENGVDGGAYEIIDPLGTTGQWIADRGGQGGEADIRDGIDSPNASTKVVKRTALVSQSWEGLEVLDNGVVIGGDELRPTNDVDGGAVFRFVPETLYACEGAPVRPGQLCDNTISDMADSPLAAGTNYALMTICTGGSNFGQGCEAGKGRWVEVGAMYARDDAAERGATGYCRPEDLHVDRSWGRFVDAENDRIRWCWTNTCGGNYGEVLCVVENDLDDQNQVPSETNGYNLLADADGELAEPFVTRFVQGDERMNSHDNLDIQPHTNNVYVIEDHQYGEIWACLPDGEDRDLMTDGCVAMLSINDPSAEPSGFIFDGTGKTAYYHVQHGEQPEDLLDFDSNPVNGYTDDLMKITGFKVKK